MKALGSGNFTENSFESKLKDGDLQKLSNAIVMEVNSLAAQLFELISLMNELILLKPKRIQKMLADEYQTNLEHSYGENILRQVVLT